MGLIKAALGAAGGVMADQWKEYFYCESIPENVMAVKGQRRVSGRSSNTKGSENIISNGSVVAVADGQCMIIVDQGKVAELCAVPGEFVYDSSTEPTIFSGELGTSILDTFKNIGKRFTFGGEPPKDQRVYYFNTKELIGNKYGTPSPVPFRVVDQRAGIDIDIAIRCFGEYSYRISDPILFYTNVCGNVSEDYTRDRLDGQLKTELLTALQPAFAKISDMGIRYSALPGHTMELAEALNEVLSGKWRYLRGLEIVSFGVSSVKASEEDAYFGVEGEFVKEEYSDHMKANYRYYKWISKDDDSHFIYVNFKENESGVYTVSAYNTSGFSGTEAIEKYLDIVKAEAAEANKAASANAEMKDFSVEIAQFAKDDVKVKIMTKIPVSGWSFDDSGRCLVENDDPTAFGAGAIRFEVRTNVEDFDYYKDDFENYQDIDDRVIGGITFKGRTYKHIGYNWIQYVAQIDDGRALSIGLTKLECVPGTMPDIILNNMTFQ